MAKDVQRLPRELTLSARVANAVRAGLSTLTAFKLTDPGGFELSIDVRRHSEQHITDDFVALFLQLGSAAKQKDVGIALSVDEVQFVKEQEFRALISALHRAAQKQLPIMLAAAAGASDPAAGRRGSLVRGAVVPVPAHRGA